MRFKEIFLGVATPAEVAAQGTINNLKGRAVLNWRRQRDLDDAIRIRKGLTFRRRTLIGAYLAAAGAGTGITLLVRERQKNTTEFGKIKRVIPLRFFKDNQDGRMDVLIFETRRVFDFDYSAFEKNVNLIAARGGKLPKYSRVFLSDTPVNRNDPAVFGITSPQNKAIRLSIHDGLNTPFYNLYLPEAVVNGVLVGELTNLMIGESGQLPPGVVSVEQLGDSTGIVASAVFSGRTYQEYLFDLTKIEYTGKGGALTFSTDTYQDFAQNLKPALIFH
ncbi:MAG: hypothetical protein A2782_04060 [Candidatus Blackburnbacteria bacterium RIFCSPHIGHO2_01_FULL_43_15b]|uniref:Uncharacterized protein n=1 Tax=Candidatus Blackburnbacteria bacterium RIFCSPHIGHO2_01_FULL_43_15b TaxID=1797513 RepID=A0A1G1V3X0_9BACT|nr:MAG: hypothetical protein A2782_04060 [Candidatus Blackburnbacteria bacterium RIFCSPHIGHO2_01_FULL_43_15b]